MMPLREYLTKYGFLLSLIYLTLVSTGFFLIGSITNHSYEYWYLLWNLFLAWIPFGLSLWLVKLLEHKPWSSWPGMVLSLLWLGFLPNSFYMVSDFLHLQDFQRVNVVFDTVTFASFVITSLFIGYASLYMIHMQLARRLSNQFFTWLIIGGVLLLCSFAIYLGRDLRLNTWDLLISPAAILFDVSGIVLDPSQNGLAFTTTFTFFVFLLSIYSVVWQFARKPNLFYKT
jgi:uncharacterized membrane protein